MPHLSFLSQLLQSGSAAFSLICREELENYPKKVYATYWECEGYPKAWGHGSDKNPLPPESVQRGKGPMRDQIWFRTATTIPRLPKSLESVPNRYVTWLINGIFAFEQQWTDLFVGFPLQEYFKDRSTYRQNFTSSSWTIHYFKIGISNFMNQKKCLLH